MTFEVIFKSISESKTRTYTGHDGVERSYNYVTARVEPAGENAMQDVFYVELRGAYALFSPQLLSDERRYTIEGQWRGREYTSEATGDVFYHNDFVVNNVTCKDQH